MKSKSKTLFQLLNESGLFILENNEVYTLEEKWIYINGEKSIYKVRNNGEVLSMYDHNGLRDKPLSMSGGLDKNGYHIISLTHKKKKYTRKVHRLVAEAFIPNPDNKPEVNHINGNKIDNRICNLEWVTTEENTQLASINGLRQGSLSPEIVEYVCVLLSSNMYSIEKISYLSGIDVKNIQKILNKKTWKNISDRFDVSNYDKNKFSKDKRMISKIRYTKTQIHEICKYLQNSNLSFSEIAGKTKTSTNVVSRIYHHKEHLAISKNYDFFNYQKKINQFE